MKLLDRLRAMFGHDRELERLCTRCPAAQTCAERGACIWNPDRIRRPDPPPIALDQHRRRLELASSDFGEGSPISFPQGSSDFTGGGGSSGGAGASGSWDSGGDSSSSSDAGGGE